MNGRWVNAVDKRFKKYWLYLEFCRTQLKAEQSERSKLMSLKDDFEKKENDWNKERSDIRGQIIALTEANVSFFAWIAF